MYVRSINTLFFGAILIASPFAAADYEYKTCPTSYDDPKIRSNKDMGAYAKLENNTGVQFAYRLTRNVEILYTGFLDNLSKYE